ncbi:MAG TPA: hypothetical protein VFK78_00480 [Gemmatimonadales bacterium]|nr:hypothetical protein [Gemmatimonadales bacterium]
MRRLILVPALAVGLSACHDLGSGGTPRISVHPLVDSLFVGDSSAIPTITFVNPAGDTVPPPAVRWQSLVPTIFHADSLTGRVRALAPGFGLLAATAGGATSYALIVVSKTLDVTMLLDTVYLLPADTLTLPVQVVKKGGGAPAPWFEISPNGAIYTVDSATGRITAVGSGVARIVVHADSVTDTGEVNVVQLTDTTKSAGKAYFTVLGTIIRHQQAAVGATNYLRSGDTLTFQLDAFVTSSGVHVQDAATTIRQAIADTGTFVIDSISPAEAFSRTADPVCHPPRQWAYYATSGGGSTITAFSRPGGAFAISKYVPVTGGFAVGGRFTFNAQRTDLYADPQGLVTVRGTFVAPLDSGTASCH